MIALLTGWGLSKTAAKLIAYVGIPLLILIAFYFTLDAYGDSRYREGKKDEEAAWKIAHERLLADAAQAEGVADTEALSQELAHAAEVEEEKEKVDAAIADGSSPFDVLFPSR